MWIKLFLLLLYILTLFLVSRLLEAAAWYERGFLSHRLLDPFALSVKKLKRLLESRGVNYAGCIEKKDLTQLVQASGEVTDGELLEVVTEEETNVSSVPSSTHFSSGSHFYEEVEDTKDSVWLVQVIPPSSSPLLDDLLWRKLHSRIASFGVRTGVFDCSVDRRLCNRKGWTVPQLLLAIPKGQRAKDIVILLNYPSKHPIRLQLILDWLQKHLMTRVHEISSTDELRNEWLDYGQSSKKSEVRLLFFSALLDPPLFLLALGVRFSGRVKVGMVNLKDKEKTNKVMQEIGIARLPCYLVVTPEKMFVYGQRIGEYFTYHRMEHFLKSLRPEANDIFLISLGFVNLLGLLNFFMMFEDCFWRHLIFSLWRLGRANCILFLAWLVILGLGQLTFMEYLSEAGLTVVRIVNGSTLSVIIRNDWHGWKNHVPWILASMITFCATGSWLYRCRRRNGTSAADASANTSSNFSDWWSASLDSYLMDCFFRPMATLTQPVSPMELDLEEGMEMLIERLAVPNFWLQPVISTDYIKDLPLWIQCSPVRNSEKGISESEGYTTDITSEDEGTCILKPPSCTACSCVQVAGSPTSFAESDDNGRTTCKCLSRKKQSSADISNENKRNRLLGYKAPPGMLECHDCAICLEMYKAGVILCGLPCGHNYHQLCIVPWLSRDNHHCPICRWPTYKPKTVSSVRLHTE